MHAHHLHLEVQRYHLVLRGGSLGVVDEVKVPHVQHCEVGHLIESLGVTGSAVVPAATLPQKQETSSGQTGSSQRSEEHQGQLVSRGLDQIQQHHSQKAWIR